MKFTAFIFIFLTFSSFASEPVDFAPMVEELLENPTTENLQNFCDVSVKQGATNVYSEAGGIRIENNFYTDETIIEMFDEEYPWQMGWFPIENLKTLVLPNALGIVRTNVDEFETEVIGTGWSPLSPSSINDIYARIHKRKSKVVADASQTRFNTATFRAAACATVGINPLNLRQCQSDILKAIETSDQRGSYVLLDVYEKILASNDYRQGILLSTRKIYEKYLMDQPEGDLFEDIYESFLQVSGDEEDAEQKTWDVLAFLATGGANIAPRISRIGISEYKHSIALSAIAGMIPLLDFKTRNSGKIYSYPPEVKSYCEISKSYHFWMTAYLTRELLKESPRPMGTLMATFSIQKGYQFAAQTYHRNPERVFYKEPFEGATNIMRIDMAYSAAATQFALARWNNEEVFLDVDAAIVQMLDDAIAMEPLQPHEANSLFMNEPQKAFIRWSKIMAPNSPFRYFKNKRNTKTPVSGAE